MTVWVARRAAPKRGGRVVVLCGRQVAGQYVCHNRIAEKAVFGTDLMGKWDRNADTDELWLPVGVTDDGSPGVFRWSARARDQRARGQKVTESSPMNVRKVRLSELPIDVPCPANHINRIDTGLP